MLQTRIAATRTLRKRSRTSTVLVLGDHRQSVAVVRSLARAGHRVLVGVSGSRPPSARSRHAAGRWNHPPLAEGSKEPFREALARLLLDDEAISALFPVGETEMQHFAREAASLPRPVRLVMPDPAAVRTCAGASRCLDAARDAGLTLPQTLPVWTRQDLARGARAFGFPCVLKRASELGNVLGRKAILIRGQGELDEVLARWADLPGGALLQAFVPGPRTNFYFAARDGVLLDHLAVEVSRTDARDGTGLAVEGVTKEPTDSVLVQSAALASHLRYTGVGCAQFLTGPGEEQAVFLELNARLGANCEIAVRSGLDLPRLALELAGVGSPRPAPPARIRTGLRFASTSCDLAGLARAIRRHELTAMEGFRWAGRAAGAALRADTHTLWRWSDPLPALAWVGRELLRAVGR